MMVFVPTDAAQLRGWRAGAAVEGDGFAATPAMLAAHEFGPGELEEAEYVALGYAAVASLLPAPSHSRWVAALEAADPVVGAEADFGLVTVAGGRWRDVTAVFVDEPGAAAEVDALSATLVGRELTEVLTDDAVLEFVAAHNLLWHLPRELDTLA